MWDSETAKRTVCFVGHDDGVTAVRVDPTRCVSGSVDSFVKLWDVRAKRSVMVLAGHMGPVTSVRLSDESDSTVVSASADATVRVWDLRRGGEGGGCLLTLAGHSSGVNDVSFDWTKVVSGGEDGSMRLWNRASGNCERVCVGHTEAVVAVKVADRYVVSAARDGVLRVWFGGRTSEL